MSIRSDDLMSGAIHHLSKSAIAAFQQCARRLWLQVHLPEAAAASDGSAQLRLTAGTQVGAIARTLIPNGTLVDTGPNMQAAIAKTAELIAKADQPIFEATLAYDDVLVQIDILMPVTTGSETAWRLIEVKSSTAPKPHHVADLATQVWVAEQGGLKIASASVRHLDRNFILGRVGHYEGLFSDAQLYDDAATAAVNLSTTIAEAHCVLASDEPANPTGAHCSSPYECEFGGHCKQSEPEPPLWPIAQLPNTGSRLAAQWGEQDIYDLRELPVEAELSPMHDRIKQAVISGQPYLDTKAFADAISQWPYPRTWLDFEAIAFAVPRWVGTKPWQAIPFQFSAHVEQSDGSIEHLEALDLTGDDPRDFIADALAKLPDHGAVIAWSKSYESARLRELAQALPRHSKKLLSLADRLVDPMPIAKAHYYHPDQRGSFSIKYVLPTVAPELDYASLHVADGMAAQAAYLEAIEPSCTPHRRDEIDAALREYCGQDTWAMVVICDRLSGRPIFREPPTSG